MSFRFLRNRQGFTLVELLVVIAIVVILISVLLPAVHGVRETANSVQCSDHLRNIGIASKNYLTDNGGNTYPLGGGDLIVGGSPAAPALTVAGQPYKNTRTQDWGWTYQILPYLDERNLWNMAASNPVGAAAQPVRVFFCPSRRGPMTIDNSAGSFGVPAFGSRATIDYAGNAGTWQFMDGTGTPVPGFVNAIIPINSNPLKNGAFGKSRFWVGATTTEVDAPIRAADFADGEQYTVLIAEKRVNAFLVDPSSGTPQIGDRLGYSSGFGPDTLRTGFYPPALDFPRQRVVDPISGLNESAANVNTFNVIDGFGSAHSTGLNVLFAGGNVRKIAYSISPSLQTFAAGSPVPVPPAFPAPQTLTLWQRLCHRNDGGLVNPSELD